MPLTKISDTSARHIRDLVGPALCRSLAVGPPERHRLYSDELRAALDEFEAMVKREEIVRKVYKLLMGRVRGDSRPDMFEMVEKLLDSAEEILGLPTVEESYGLTEE